MNFINSTKSLFQKWLDFKTRSSRSEYWFGYLGIMLITLALTFFAVILEANQSMLAVLGILNLVFSLFAAVAQASLTARRLHDVGRSGWWQLIVLTVIGIIPLIIWICTKGKEESNEYGENSLMNINN